MKNSSELRIRVVRRVECQFREMQRIFSFLLSKCWRFLIYFYFFSCTTEWLCYSTWKIYIYSSGNDALVILILPRFHNLNVSVQACRFWNDSILITISIKFWRRKKFDLSCPDIFQILIRTVFTVECWKRTLIGWNKKKNLLCQLIIWSRLNYQMSALEQNPIFFHLCYHILSRIFLDFHFIWFTPLDQHFPSPFQIVDNGLATARLFLVRESYVRWNKKKKKEN